MKRKRLLALIMSLALVVVFTAGCDNSGSGGDAAADTGDAAAADAGDAAAGAVFEGKDVYGLRYKPAGETTGDPADVKIAYIPLSTAGVTNSMVQKALEEQIVFYPNITIEYFDPMYDLNKQISMINECVTQGFDAIMLEAADTEALNITIADAEAAGVPVVTINVGASGLHTLHVQGNDYSSGREAGRMLAEGINGEGNVILLDCPAAQKPISLMGTGFEDYINEEAAGVTLLESQPIDNWSPEIANTVMRDLLTKYDDIDGVYAVSDDIAQGAVQAIEAAGRQNEIKVYGSMGYPNTLQAIKDGKVYGTYFSDGYLEYATALYLTILMIETGITSVNAGYTATPVIDMPTVPTTAANVENVIKDSRWETLGLYEFK
ncbi:MAG: sugar ABC transporter substrate-binding protein [Clostridiales Family XIII bacterium]|jgi:ribose transport system substrate-binding protein|nr:sugar ABC transporter substrate-binding protein [Clostridiales Family XIII bacterium]